MDADYTGKVNVIIRNHGNTRYEFKVDDCKVQRIVERIDMQDAMEIDELDKTERGIEGFSSSDIGPKGFITGEELEVTMCFLNSNPQHNP